VIPRPRDLSIVVGKFRSAKVSESDMKLHRRTFLHLAAAAAAGAQLATTRAVEAQIYPSRPVRLIVAFPPGGTADIAARLIGHWLSDRLGQPFIIENRPGANANIATEAVVRSPPDGYTLLLAGPSNAINASITDKLNYNFLRDITPVAGVALSPLVLEVNPAFPVHSVPELIAYTKANPGKISLASYGTGTISHLAGELLKITGGVEMVHVPYRGSTPMLPDLLSGQVQAAIDNLPASIGHIRAGRLRALAVTTAIRSEALPDLPTVGEYLKGYEANAWSAIAAPKKTPPAIVEIVNNEINAGLRDPDLNVRLADLGAVALPGSPADLSKFIAYETEKWAKVIRAAHIKVE
jgi:tripartite-type tricarboxylate transporter receptor subunit TctC